MRDKDGVMIKWKKLKKGNPRKQTGIVQSVNPVAMSSSTGGMSGGCGDPMPPAIHGTVSEE